MNSPFTNVIKSQFIFKLLTYRPIYLACNSVSDKKFSSLTNLNVKKSLEYIPVNNPIHIGAACLNKQMIRCRTNKRNSTKGQSNDDDSDDDDDDIDDVDDGSYSDLEVDYETPAVYRHMHVHSQRADHLIHKGLGISRGEADKLFYGSKFVFQGKTLLKKAKQLEVGDSVDVIDSKKDDKLLVKRVKIVKVSNRLTKSGKPNVVIRVWKRPFEVDSPK